MIIRARRTVVGPAVERGLQTLAPPYGSLRPLESIDDARTLPLGIIVVGRDDRILAVLVALMQLAYACPWAVPCLVLAPKHDPLEPLLVFVEELRPRLVVVTTPEGARPKGLIAAIVRGARNRIPPAPAVLARWVTHRLKDPALETPLQNQFEIACATPRRLRAPASPPTVVSSVATDRTPREIGGPSPASAGTRRPPPQRPTGGGYACRCGR